MRIQYELDAYEVFLNRGNTSVKIPSLTVHILTCIVHLRRDYGKLRHVTATASGEICTKMAFRAPDIRNTVL